MIINDTVVMNSLYFVVILVITVVLVCVTAGTGNVARQSVPRPSHAGNERRSSAD